MLSDGIRFFQNKKPAPSRNPNRNQHHEQEGEILVNDVNCRRARSGEIRSQVKVGVVHLDTVKQCEDLTCGAQVRMENHEECLTKCLVLQRVLLFQLPHAFPHCFVSAKRFLNVCAAVGIFQCFRTTVPGGIVNVPLSLRPALHVFLMLVHSVLLKVGMGLLSFGASGMWSRCKSRSLPECTLCIAVMMNRGGGSTTPARISRRSQYSRHKRTPGTKTCQRSQGLERYPSKYASTSSGNLTLSVEPMLAIVW